MAAGEVFGRDEVARAAIKQELDRACSQPAERSPTWGGPPRAGPFQPGSDAMAAQLEEGEIMEQEGEQEDNVPRKGGSE